MKFLLSIAFVATILIGCSTKPVEYEKVVVVELIEHRKFEFKPYVYKVMSLKDSIVFEHESTISLNKGEYVRVVKYH